MAGLCSLFWIGTVVLTGHPYSSIFFLAWNTFVRSASFVAIGWSVSQIKRNLDFERETSRELSESVIERRKTEEALRALTANLEQRVLERTKNAEAKAKQLQTLAMQLIESEEQERRRISELLHDDLQQILSAALLHLDACSEKGNQAPELEYVKQLLKDSVHKARSLAHELSPAVLYHYGLVAGLEWLARQMDEKFGLRVRLEVNAKQKIDHALTQVFVYRAVQELLFNIVKHAKVRDAWVTLENSENFLQITVSDQGSGFDAGALAKAGTKSGLGLVGLRERAQYFGGDLEIASSPGRGSRFTLKLPIEGGIGEESVR